MLFTKLFGSLLSYSYLCTVRMKVLAIRAESREGKTISTLPILKVTFGWLCFFILFDVTKSHPSRVTFHCLFLDFTNNYESFLKKVPKNFFISKTFLIFAIRYDNV